MLTLKQLKELVRTPKAGERVPNWKELREGSTVCARKMAGRDGAEVIAYENGYLVYHIGSYYTVFPINLETSYTYPSVDEQEGASQEDRNVTDSCFDNAEWCLLPILIGEDRMQNNSLRRDRAQGMLSLSDLYEDGENMENPMKYYSSQLEEDILLREFVCQLFDLLNERQRLVVKRVFWDEMTRKEIAEEMGFKNHASVAYVLKGALAIMRRAAEKK